MNKISILIVEDEAGISNFIATILEANNYHVLKASHGQEALSILSSPDHPELILLDLGLPDIDGLKLLQNLRTWSSIPVIVVSARGNEWEKVAALDLGADDYITKPFGTSELLARIRTALRHHSNSMEPEESEHIFVTGQLCVDFGRRRITLDGAEVHLTQIEYKIVTLLAQNAGKVLTYDSIIQEIWGLQAPRDNQILRVNMANIRRKLEQNPAEPRYIMTEIGVGYRMMDH